jgi:WXG100 family type VII secretion target
MAGYKMQFGAVETAGSDLGTGATNIETKLNDMDTALKPLQADWTGEASEAYVQAKAKWNAALSEMKQILTEISRQDADEGLANETRNRNRW